MSNPTQKIHEPVFWKDLAAGYISGVANVLSGQPFDICKVRIQSTGKGTLLSHMKSIVKEEGVLTLWKGSLFPLICFGMCNSICFAVNEHFKYEFKKWRNTKNIKLQDYYISGGIAGIANTIISAPMEHIRIRMQTARYTGAVYKGSIDCAVQIIKQHGLTGLYKGFLITLYREFFLYGTYFAVYEYLKKLEEKPSKLWMLFCGGCGGSAAFATVFQLDNIKSRIQTDSFTNPKYPSLMKIHKQLGIKDVSKGFTPGFVRGFPVNAITFLVFEFAKNALYDDIVL